jgi:hypothetical protein
MTGRVVSVIVAVGIAIVGGSVGPTETRAVRARVTALAGALDVGADETDLQRIARAASLVNALTPDVVVTLDEHRRVAGREMVVGAARQAMQTRGGTRVELDRLEVVLGADRATAVADVTMRVDGGYHDVRLQLVKPDGTWLVQSAEVVRPLTRPGGP